MKFNVCPRCLEEYFEKLETYAYCHSCNFNSIEAYAWNDRERVIRVPTAYVKSVNLKSTRKGASALDPLFTKTDYAVVRRALLGLSEIERLVILLRFWDRNDVPAIAYHLGLQARTVEKYLDRAYTKIKEFCLRHADFSRAQPQYFKAAA